MKRIYQSLIISTMGVYMVSSLVQVPVVAQLVKPALEADRGYFSAKGVYSGHPVDVVPTEIVDGTLTNAAVIDGTAGAAVPRNESQLLPQRHQWNQFWRINVFRKPFF